MRYVLSIILTFLLLGAHTLEATLQPQEWGVSEIPAEWHDALTQKMTEIEALTDQTMRVAQYLELLHNVCREQGLEEEVHAALADQVKELVFQGLLKEVKHVSISRDARSSEFARYVMTTTRMIRDIDLHSVSARAQAYERLAIILNAGMCEQGVTRSSLTSPKAEEIAYDEYMRMRAEKAKLVEQAYTTKNLGFIAVGITGSAFIAALLISGYFREEKQVGQSS